jgi:hypothetical protein
MLAALDCSGGDLQATFTAEDLLLAAWKRDPLAWGLRGHEREHPDSEKIYKELDRVTVAGRNLRGGLAGLGLLEKVYQRTYRLTPSGLALATKVPGADPSMHAMAERTLADAISAILSHPVFIAWIKDPSHPRNFRDAGHFWGVAPGTPPTAIRRRIADIDHTLETARSLLDDKGQNAIAASHGRILFDRADVERAAEFQSMLKNRFKGELAILEVVL